MTVSGAATADTFAHRRAGGQSKASVFNDTVMGPTERQADGVPADRLIGGAGNDTFTTDSLSDVIVEQANEGTDLINSSISYVLPANVEKLTLTGTAATSGTGNELGNTITGNAAANALDGGLGDDALTGGDGADTLTGGVGNDKLTGGLGADSIAGGIGDDTTTSTTRRRGGRGGGRGHDRSTARSATPWAPS